MAAQCHRRPMRVFPHPDERNKPGRLCMIATVLQIQSSIRKLKF